LSRGSWKSGCISWSGLAPGNPVSITVLDATNLRGLSLGQTCRCCNERGARGGRLNGRRDVS
jgi:hypothetical protein